MLSKENYKVLQHKTLHDRIEAAKILKCYIPKTMAIYVDSMSNTANLAYGAQPERLYIIDKEKVVYEGGIGPFYYDVDEVKDWLNAYQCQQEQSTQQNHVMCYQSQIL
ncbi:thyroxine 5-deiodinase isoform X3 [Exaiptasia diaphana]|uniref:Iodothyronine deiodinase n=1 Tax=Exaiptasia diaphana TaxID=2652724 RepID=A0A913YEN0_EXADI|nr:thyroxine 5-deiodinase isoform X3 [Exaiptasia diaphana]